MATLTTNLGGLIQEVGVAWMMTTITDSMNMVSFVQAATTLPIMLFSVPAGVLADSLDRRRIMLTAQIFIMAISTTLAAFAWFGLMSPFLLLASTFLIGCGVALHFPSWQASMADVLPRKEIPGGVTLNSMGFNLMRCVGPAIGGVIVAIAGAAVAFAFAAVSYIPLIVTLARWKYSLVPTGLPREAFSSAMCTGLRYVLMSPNLLTVMSRGFVFGVGAVAVLALLPLVTRDLLSDGALTYGVLLGCFGVGAIGGAVASPRLRGRLSNEMIARSAFGGFALGTIVLSLSREIWLSYLALFLAGACWVLALSLFNMTVQLSTPRWVVGRALALYQTATFGGMASGSWVWGVVAEANGLPLTLLSAGGVLVLGSALGLRFSMPEFSTLNLDPLDSRSRNCSA